MEWVSDVSAGDWIRERLEWDPQAWTIHHLVPEGMPAYARIFHPIHRERPVGRAWPPEGDLDAWERFATDEPEIDAERITWKQAADVFGATMHPLAQWGGIIGAEPDDWNPESARDADGWRYDGPNGGGIMPEVLAGLAAPLLAHTSTPDDGFVAVWEGWGDLVGAMSSRHGLRGDTPHEALMQASVKDVFNNVFRRPKWRPGILSDEISRGPRLELRDRGHVLFRATPRTWADPSWPARVPWSEENSEWTHPPSLIWPAGREWVVAGDIDLDTSLVAGSVDLIHALVEDPAVEASEIPAGGRLWGPDPINGPRG
ncbi:hypothetical protein [Microbacterium sp. G2-8]|uniref:hypothetical protein n=1 Tax=Microbacterium sp. G2-8 TaxID=2842454 RepID=UPI001C89951E|nr:hypothetical protein [Microbacterium sp. G2-8]